MDVNDGKKACLDELHDRDDWIRPHGQVTASFGRTRPPLAAARSPPHSRLFLAGIEATEGGSGTLTHRDP